MYLCINKKLVPHMSKVYVENAYVEGQLFQKSISNEFPQISGAGFSQLLVSNIELVSNMKVND